MSLSQQQLLTSRQMLGAGKPEFPRTHVHELQSQQTQSRSPREYAQHVESMGGHVVAGARGASGCTEKRQAVPIQHVSGVGYIAPMQKGVQGVQGVQLGS